jgi:flagellar biogenesis protein FliO
LHTTLSNIAALAQQAGALSVEQSPLSATHYGVQLARSILALLAACAAAWWLLRWAARHGIGRAPPGQALRVRERVSLDGRTRLYLVELGARVLLLGGSDRALSLLAELTRDELDGASAHKAGEAQGGTRSSFRSVLAAASLDRAARTDPPVVAVAGEPDDVTDGSA